MNKINTYAIFGIMFFAVTLLTSGMYSNKVFAQHENVDNLNEAEINDLIHMQ